MKIYYTSIDSLMRLNKTVQDHIENYVEMFDINGLA